MSDAGTCNEILQQRAGLVEAWLEQLYQDDSVPPRLAEAVRYSLLGGGKRLRPVLCLSAALACRDGVAEATLLRDVMPFAAALEMIHSYSLVHDDLPAMDDDDLRRGKATNHKVFGEATAILAGDALLTDAFRHMCSCPLPPERLLAAIAVLAEAAGSSGMVGGQILDLAAEGKLINAEALADLNARKTGALLRAACECGAILAGADEARRTALREYGRELGIAFQINDDILDVVGDEKSMGKKPGQDAAHGKSTWPALLGLEEARTQAALHSSKAEAALPPSAFSGADGDFLRQLPLSLQKRNN